jgi:hypothetical protein
VIEQKTQGRAWHYTTAQGLAGILGSKSIQASTTDVPEDEMPMVWFSAAPFEPTMRETALEISNGKRLRPKTVQDYRLFGMGLYRLGLPTTRLMRYTTQAKTVGIGFTRRRKLEQIAQKYGSLPHLWYFTPAQVLLSDVDLDFSYHDGKAWVQAGLADASTIFREQMAALEPAFRLMASGK